MILFVVDVVDLSLSTSYTGERVNEGFLIAVNGLLVGYVEDDCIAVGAYWFDGVGSGCVDDCARQNSLLYFLVILNVDSCFTSLILLCCKTQRQAHSANCVYPQIMGGSRIPFIGYTQFPSPRKLE